MDCLIAEFFIFLFYILIFLQVIPGLRLRDALSKALKRRNLTCEMCEVTTLTRDKPIHWDTDISLIRAEEVYVKVTDKFPIMTHISHQVIKCIWSTLKSEF